MQSALSNRVWQFLGRLSFPLYLMQFPVLIAVTSLMVIGLPLSLGTAVLACAVSLAATILAASAFYLAERFAIWFSNRLIHWPAKATV